MTGMDILDDLLFDDTAWQIAHQRMLHLQAATAQWQNEHQEWQTLFQMHPTPHHGALVAQAVQEFRQRTSSRWMQRFADVAIQLDLLESHGYQPIIQRCYGRGWFDEPQRSRQQPVHRPPLADIASRVRALLDTYPTVAQRTTAFVDNGICRTPEIAKNVATMLIDLKVRTQAAAAVSSLFEAWIHYGSIGLLYASAYPWLDVLYALHQYLHTASHTEIVPTTLQRIRHDLVALRQSIQMVSSTLWEPMLLHAPKTSTQRQRYMQRLQPSQKHHLLRVLHRFYPDDESFSDTLLAHFLTNGIAGVIALRTPLSPTTSHENLEQHHIDQALKYLCQGLDRSVQTLMRERIEHLRSAARGLGVDLPYRLLIADHPTSRRRYRWRQQYLQTNRPHRTPSRTWKPQPWLQRVPASYTPTTLIEAFAERALLTKEESKTVVHNLITYGAIGLIPQRLWPKLVDQRLYEWLCLIRLGHRSGALNWNDIFERATELCHSWHIPCPSTHVLQTLFQTRSKPRFWHGGKGLVTINIHQRVPTVVTERPQLNATWAVLGIPVPWSLHSGRSTQYVILVVDWETQLPLGGWVTMTKPTHYDINVALYQALWHYGTPSWPIRGIPRRIVLAESLAISDTDDLQRSCWYLMTQLERDDLSLRGKFQLQHLIDRLKHSTNHLFDDPAGRVRDLTQIILRVLHWIQHQSFPHHRQTVLPPDLRMRGVALPASTTPAAGWLLPRAGVAAVNRDTIIVDDIVYQIPPDTIDDGALVTYRRCPIFVPTHDSDLKPLPHGLFVEKPNTSHLIYIVEQ